MTLLAAIEQNGFGETKDTGCDYVLSSVKPGSYSIKLRTFSGNRASVILRNINNARDMEKAFATAIWKYHYPFDTVYDVSMLEGFPLRIEGKGGK